MLTHFLNLTNNQLSSIADGVTTNSYAFDLKNQQANNYIYDPIGDMKSDLQGGFTNRAAIEFRIGHLKTGRR